MGKNQVSIPRWTIFDAQTYLSVLTPSATYLPSKDPAATAVYTVVEAQKQSQQVTVTF